MFSKGDKIVYPLYGAGEIEEIEEKKVNGVLESYYVIKIPTGNLKIMVSEKKADTVGLRRVSDSSFVMETMDMVSKMPVIANENWNQRYKDNMEKIKGGRLCDVAEVVRNLILREQKKGLSTAEKKMLNSAKQIILSEISYSVEIEKEKAEELLAKSLLNC